MKRCPECGNICGDDASFCPRCGCMLPSTPDVYVPPNYYRPTPRRSSQSAGKVVAVIAVVAILLAVGWSFVNQNRDSDTSGDKTIEYEWYVPISGISTVKYSVTLTISGEEYEQARSSSIDRSGSASSIPDYAHGVYAVKEYVVVTDTIRTLANSLWAEYKTKILDNPLVPSSYKTPKMFSDYVLTFVQVAAKYATDSSQFGEDEYWLYPIETLYRCKGDCEDTSILASAIFSALSEMEGPDAYVLGSCVFLLPGHAMVGADVSGGIAADAHLSPFFVTVGTSNYYFGETTIDDLSYKWMGIGEIESSYLGASAMGYTGYSTEYVR